MIIDRILAAKVAYAAKKFPIVSLTGPRQSGKTTLLREHFRKLPYVSLEDPDLRNFAQSDPRQFLSNYPSAVILDEVQHMPSLFSYIQTASDLRNKTGQFILSGSQNFLMNKKIPQSLAGRAGILKLLPFSMEEMQHHHFLKSNLWDQLHKGFYPRLFDKKIDPVMFYSSYVETYLKRDVQDLVNVTDLNTFLKFLKLCAGRTGQLLNLSSLANDTGVAVNTVKSWLGILEASYIIFLLQPYHQNFRKRLVKSPKMFFWDTGLASYLLGIKSSSELKTHFAKGALFENLVVAEYGKYFYNRGMNPDFYFWRDKTGNEIDCIIENRKKVRAIEIKSGTTVNDDFFKGLLNFQNLSKSADLALVYGGNTKQTRTDIEVLGWKDMLEALK
ncbi:MAG: ATP-binding protein [Chitinophagales bacterium]